jgi:hypothetical protein
MLPALIPIVPPAPPLCKRCRPSHHYEPHCPKIPWVRSQGTGHIETVYTMLNGMVCYLCCDFSHYANNCSISMLGSRWTTCGGAGHGDPNNPKHTLQCATPQVTLVCTACSQTGHRAKDCSPRPPEYSGSRGFGLYSMCMNRDTCLRTVRLFSRMMWLLNIVLLVALVGLVCVY